MTRCQMTVSQERASLQSLDPPSPPLEQNNPRKESTRCSANDVADNRQLKQKRQSQASDKEERQMSYRFRWRFWRSESSDIRGCDGCSGNNRSTHHSRKLFCLGAPRCPPSRDGDKTTPKPSPNRNTMTDLAGRRDQTTKLQERKSAVRFPSCCFFCNVRHDRSVSHTRAFAGDPSKFSREYSPFEPLDGFDRKLPRRGGEYSAAMNYPTGGKRCDEPRDCDTYDVKHLDSSNRLRDSLSVEDFTELVRCSPKTSGSLVPPGKRTGNADTSKNYRLKQEVFKPAVLSSTTAATPADASSVDSPRDYTLRNALSMPGLGGELLLAGCLPAVGYPDGPRRCIVDKRKSLCGTSVNSEDSLLSFDGLDTASTDHFWQRENAFQRRISSASLLCLYGVNICKKYVSRKSDDSLIGRSISPSPSTLMAI